MARTWLDLTDWHNGASVRVRVQRALVVELVGAELSDAAFADWIGERSNRLIAAGVRKAAGGSTWLIELGREDLA